MLGTLAFSTIALLVTGYVLLDGYDLGVAAIAPLIGHNARERGAAMASIGPFWNGNEVWLIVAGAAVFALFPVAYASSFSGFYLPFIVVLWMLMFRGIAMELRDHLDSDLWRQFWDAAFWLSSVALMALFGVALGNLVRGVPLDRHGYFTGTFAFLLNPYALLVGVFAIVALAQHGAAFARLRIEGAPAQRSARLQPALWWVTLVLYVALTAATFAVRAMPPTWLIIMPVVSLVGLFVLRHASRTQHLRRAFAASAVFLTSLLVEAAGTLYPYLLPAFPAGRGGISVADAAPPSSLVVGLVVTLGGTMCVLIYTIAVWRGFAAKVRVK